MGNQQDEQQIQRFDTAVFYESVKKFEEYNRKVEIKNDILVGLLKRAFNNLGVSNKDFDKFLAEATQESSK